MPGTVLRDLGCVLVLVRMEGFGLAAPNTGLLRWRFGVVRRWPVSPVYEKLGYTDDANNGTAPMPVVGSVIPPEGVLCIVG